MPPEMIQMTSKRTSKLYGNCEYEDFEFIGAYLNESDIEIQLPVVINV